MNDSHRNTGRERVVSAEEAAILAGVSTETIQQYAKFGLIQPVADRSLEKSAPNNSWDKANQDERMLFSVEDIEKVFLTDAGLNKGGDKGGTGRHILIGKRPETKNAQPQDDPGSEATSAQPVTLTPSESPATQAPASAQPSEPILASTQRSASENTSISPLNDALVRSEQTSTATLAMTQEGCDASNRQSTIPRANTPTQSSYAQGSYRQVDATDYVHFDIIEVNRSLRQRIEELKEERDWLRNRIEKMEMRTERDQVMMLSESDTVRHLVPGLIPELLLLRQKNEAMPQSPSIMQRILVAIFPSLGRNNAEPRE